VTSAFCKIQALRIDVIERLDRLPTPTPTPADPNEPYIDRNEAAAIKRKSQQVVLHLIRQSIAADEARKAQLNEQQASTDVSAR